MLLFIFFFNDTATTEIYTLSLHDALPISRVGVRVERVVGVLERLEPRPELVVQQAGQQLGEGQERLPLLGREVVGAHGDDAGLAERDESLTGHVRSPSRRSRSSGNRACSPPGTVTEIGRAHV